jgi:hypothetical protein
MKTAQPKLMSLLAVAVLCICVSALAAEHDYYGTLHYPKALVPGVGLDKVEQEGGPDATGYQRRTVQWWPRQGQDIVDVPEGVPLRTWTRNKGQTDKEALAGASRNWTTSDDETFKAHLIGFRGFGIETPDPRFNGYKLTPAAVLRMENGERRAVMVYPPFHSMVSPEDHAFIHKIWQQAWKKLQATQSKDEYVSSTYRVKPDSLVIETDHYTWVSDAQTPYKNLWWMRPHEPEKQNVFRKGSLEYAENMWTHIEATGSSMPYWRLPKPWKKYNILIRLAIDGGYAGGGFGACDLRDATGGPRNEGLGHEWYHGHPHGGWSTLFFGESVCHGGRHLNLPGETPMFSHNFCYPWRNVSSTQYQCPLWYFALGDNPNWGDGILSVAGCLAAASEPTAYHTIARLGQQRGLWKNGVKGFGDFFGEYAARMVTCDFVMQYAIRNKYGMPEMSFLQPVYGKADRYRIPSSEAPRTYGFNVVRLVPAKGAKKITVDFDGLHDARLYGDWRACIVAVDGNGRARYSQLWNKGEMDFALRADDKHLWLTVAATPSALPLSPEGNCDVLLAGIHAPRYPWEVTLSGCNPGTPHRRQGDVINLDELYTLNNGNQYLSYSVKNEIPIPLTDDDGPLAQKKLADMDRRIALAANGRTERIGSRKVDASEWWERGMVRVGNELTRRVKFLQKNAKGHRHANGGGFVADSARVAATAYVGPNAMVLDGARVEENACIHEFAVVYGPETVIRGNAKIGGKAWVFGDIIVSGNARILESVTVTTLSRSRIGHGGAIPTEGQAVIDGNVVLKGEHVLRLCGAKGQKLTGELVMDYTPGYNGTVSYYELIPGIANLESGVYQYGRIWGRQGLGDGADAGGLYANWQFNQPATGMLEDSYVNNNGVLHGMPKFKHDSQLKYVVFNGKDQYAEAPPSVADFAELTIDMVIKRSGRKWGRFLDFWTSGHKGGRLFDFGTGDDECVYLDLADKTGELSLIARHKGKTFRVAASQALPIDAWSRVRVEMDGLTAAIYVDDKELANGEFAFRPRDVFGGDRAEGNFIGCSRNRDRFFKGLMDHFRIYREVHENFGALDPAPFALTQVQEWTDADQHRADTWEARRKVKEAELNRSAKIVVLDARVKELAKEKRDLEQEKRSLEQKTRDEFNALPGTVTSEKEIKELKAKAGVLSSRVRQDNEYKKLAERIQACEQQRRELEKAIRNSAAFKALSVPLDAVNGRKQKAEQRIRQLPTFVETMRLADEEGDLQKKRVLIEKYNGLFQSEKLSDLKWQMADIAQRRVQNQRRTLEGAEHRKHVGLATKNNEHRRLRGNLSDLTEKLRGTYPELSKLDKLVWEKQGALTKARKRHEDKQRGQNEYTQVGEAYAAASKALRDEKNRLFEKAGVSGRNPFSKSDATQHKNFQKTLEYHSTADWDHRTREEVSGAVPPKMENWLLRVRGF